MVEEALRCVGRVQALKSMSLKSNFDGDKLATHKYLCPCREDNPHIWPLYSGLEHPVYIQSPEICIDLTSHRTGAILHSTETSEALLKAGPVRCAALSASGRNLITSADDKVLKVWDVETLSISSAR